MRDFAEKLVVTILWLAAIALCFRIAIEPDNFAVCAERWRYQHTSADTLATVRSGCAIPTEGE